jgi:hypothetical protein
MNKLRWIYANRIPYQTRNNNIFRKGNSSLLEIPISAFLIPYIGTSLRIFPGLTRFIRSLLIMETRVNGKPLVFLTHPNEFIDESDIKRQITKRANSYPAYLIKDLLRSKLKAKNLGPAGIAIFERELEFLKKKEFRFLTITEYRDYLNNTHAI